MRRKNVNAILMAMACTSIPLSTIATCNPRTGSLDVFRYDDDYYYDDGFYIDEVIYYDDYYYDDCFFFDCY